MDIRLALLATELFRSIRITWGYVLILTVLVMQRSFTSSAHLSKPINTVHFIGDRMNIEYSSNSSMPPVDWEFSLAGTSDFSFIYTAGRITGSLSSRYKIDTDGKTRYDIVIDSVDSSHAGAYRCTPITEEVINASSYTAQLIVLGSDPVCGTNASASNGGIVSGEYIRMWCTVNYTGNWIPVMEWTRKDGQTIDTVIIYRPTNTSITSSLTVQLNSSDNEVTFTCITSFKPTSTMISRTLRPGEGHASNVPYYQNLWNFTANVSYAPRNLTVIPRKCVYEVGDRLACWADGNPTSTYEWIDIETNRTIHGSVSTIEDHMTSDKCHSFRCTAYNTVAGISRHTSETVTFTVRGTAASSETVAIALTAAGVIAIIGLVALGLGVALTVKACTKSNSVNRKSSDETPTQHHEYEMVTESNVQPRDGENLSLNQSRPHEEDGTEDHSAEAIACEGYSSLKRGSSVTFVQPAIYAQLQLYANISSRE